VNCPAHSEVWNIVIDLSTPSGERQGINASIFFPGGPPDFPKSKPNNRSLAPRTRLRETELSVAIDLHHIQHTGPDGVYGNDSQRRRQGVDFRVDKNVVLIASKLFLQRVCFLAISPNRDQGISPIDRGGVTVACIVPFVIGEGNRSKVCDASKMSTHQKAKSER
jgi:hypothetical protein